MPLSDLLIKNTKNQSNKKKNFWKVKSMTITLKLANTISCRKYP